VSGSASQAIETSYVGGSTVVVSVDAGEQTASEVLVTVSETVAPCTFLSSLHVFP
jgi:hypothetical protein